MEGTASPSTGPQSAPGQQVGTQSQDEVQEVTIESYHEDTVYRDLRGIHTFMITISAALGVGLYVRSATILATGGPGAVLLSFGFVGIIACCVMQGLAELLCLWPVAGALVEFVSKFVDRDLGIAVGITYWFTYAIDFAAMMTAIAGEAEYWTRDKGNQVAMFIVAPILVVSMNLFGVKLYGHIEVVGGTLKLGCILVVILLMIAINRGAGDGEVIGIRYMQDASSVFPKVNDGGDGGKTVAVESWAAAFFLSISIASFAFVGVEVPAATALETRQSNRRRDPRIHYAPAYIPIFTTIVYVVAGLTLSLNIEWTDERLIRVSWISPPSPDTNTNSGFVLSAMDSGIPHLGHIFTGFLVLTAFTAANTNLYVASRTLFGLTRRIEVTNQFAKTLAWFGKTNRYRVPVRAMVLSCCFLWVPFLYLAPGYTITSLLEILTSVGSVGCFIVWSCACVAFLRFYHCLEVHKDRLMEDPRFVHVCRSKTRKRKSHYPWVSHGQPVTACVGLVGCVVIILIIAPSAAFWARFYPVPFLSAYLAPLCFIALWMIIKIIRMYRSSENTFQWWEDLSDIEEVKEKIRELDELVVTTTSHREREEQSESHLEQGESIALTTLTNPQ